MFLFELFSGIKTLLTIERPAKAGIYVAVHIFNLYRLFRRLGRGRGGVEGVRLGEWGPGFYERALSGRGKSEGPG